MIYPNKIMVPTLRAEMAQGHSSPAEGDYIGPDGLLVCGKCGVHKQCRVTYGGRERIVGCLCRCP